MVAFRFPTGEAFAAPIPQPLSITLTQGRLGLGKFSEDLATKEVTASHAPNGS